MAATRLSQLQQRILRWLAADAQRTKGVIASSHQELVCALQGDKGNISHSLRTLEAHGWIVIGRSTGGKAEYVVLTPRGQNWVAQFAGSCD
jgi:DNA-binding MarR family transcriptional regulator